MKRVLFVKKKFLDLILENKKTVEVRICYPSFKNLKVGDTILFNRKYPFETIRVKRYKDFKGLLENENSNKIYPSKTKEELLGELRNLYPPEKEALGLIAIEIRPVT